MKKRLFTSVMIFALLASSMPVNAEGVKWLEKCTDASKVQVSPTSSKVESPTLAFNSADKSITVTPAASTTTAQSYNLTLKPDGNVSLSNSQTYVAIEASLSVENTRRLNRLVLSDGTKYSNNGATLQGVTLKLSNGHTLVVYGIIESTTKEDDDKLRNFLYENYTYQAKEVELCMKPITADAFTIYNVGFYSLGDLLTEYTELQEKGWNLNSASCALSLKKSFSATIGFDKTDSPSTVEFNYLQARALINLPTIYNVLDLRSMKLEEDQVPLTKDAFKDLNFSGNIRLASDHYKLFPTMNGSVQVNITGSTYYAYCAYKDGVNPAETKSIGGKTEKLYSYTRSMKAGNNSCVLPFDINTQELVSGLKAFEFVSCSDGQINFKEAIGVVKAGTPLLIKAESDGLYLISAAETPNVLKDFSYKEANDIQGNKFVGSFVKEVPSNYDNRYGLDSKATSFMKMKDTTKTTYYRAFLSLAHQTSEAKAFELSFDGATTGVNLIDAGTANDDAYYNLQGIKMNPNHLPHGIYIHHGKKIVK